MNAKAKTAQPAQRAHATGADGTLARIHVPGTPAELLAIEGGAAPVAQRPLGEHLVEVGLVSQAAVREAMALQAGMPGRRLGWILVMLDWLTRDELDRVIASRVGIPSVSLAAFPVPRDMPRRLPVAIARSANMAFVHEDERHVWVAFADVTDARAVALARFAAFAAGKRVVAVQASRGDIEQFNNHRDPSWVAPVHPYLGKPTRPWVDIAKPEWKAMPQDSLDFVAYAAH